MATVNFQRDGIGWQLGKLRRHLGEWIEVATRVQGENNADISIPPWITYLLNFCAWVMLILCSAWLGLAVYRLARNYWLERQGIGSSLGAALPLEPTLADLLQAAQKFYQQQDYYAACRYLYLALLQYLDSRRILSHQLSRTDGEYRRSLADKSIPKLGEYYKVINLHEKLSFSQFVAREQDFIDCKDALNQVINQP
ncbi:MAG: hypothetical protein CV045_04625 [Cyanobacteria bacterium M5B4]|nr:MAG: hypothetical protein CV045_04625 [Cyanobacteria bacterium M5B4]